MYTYCRGSWRRAWCKRLAHYVVGRAEDHAGDGYLTCRIARASARDAMFCKQHAEEYARYRNALLRDARDEARAAEK